MKSNDLDDIQQVAALLQTGAATRRDMIALLILMREHLSGVDQPMLLDISHCVAHSKRDRGLAYEYIEGFLGEFIDIAKNGGTLRVETLFPIQKVIEELGVALKDLSITVANDKALWAQTDHIESLLKEVLDGVELKISHEHVSKCSFQSTASKQGVLLSFITSFTGLEKAGALQIPTNVAFAFPVFT